MAPRRSFLFLAVLLALLSAPARGEEGDEPPSPAERVAALRREYAGEHADLGAWGAGKKLGRLAEAHLRIAIRLDRDQRKARSRLGHRHLASGEWSEERAREVPYSKAAVAKHGEEMERRELELVAAEAAAFAKLGRELLAEGEEELGRRLCLRAHLLDPGCEPAAEGLGLVRIQHGWGTGDEAETVSRIPAPEDAGIQGLLARTIGQATVVRRCGAAVAETVSDRAAADYLARLAHQTQLLTTMRFGMAPRGVGWVNLVVARGQPMFHEFIEKVGFREPYLSALKKLGTARTFRPVPFTAGFVVPTGDPKSRAPLFTHCVAEWVLIREKPQGIPAWLHEAVGLDACLTFLGRPGPLCVTFESSQGLTTKDLLEAPETWPRLLLRRAALSDLPRTELLIRAQLQALGTEDAIAARLLYRWLLLTQRAALADYLARVVREEPPEAAFEGAFGMRAEDATGELAALLTGG